MQARLSKDQRLVAFVMRGEAGMTTIFAAPFRGNTPVSESDWIAVTDGKSWDTAPQFSPDGKLIYFTSSRDGFRCVWAQRVDAAGRSAGEPIAVQHLHRARRSPSLSPLNGLDLFVGSDRILISLGDLSGGIWLGTPRE